MAEGRIGLDIGSTAVRAAELIGRPRPASIRAAQVPLPAGAVENGEVREPEVVAMRCASCGSGAGFKGRQVYLGVGNQRVVVREIALPYLPEKELRASLGFQVQEFIPMSVDEAVLDYDPIGEFEQEDRQMLRMLLVAAQRVDGRPARRRRDRPRSSSRWVSTSSRSRSSARWARPTSAWTWRTTGEEAVIDIGSHVTNIVVHARGNTRFVRILPSGGRDITVAIARAAGVEDDVAERLKRGLDVEDDPDAPTPEDVREVAMQRARRFVDEIRSSLEFYTAQSREARGSEGPRHRRRSKLEGLLDLMRQRIPVPVGPGHVFQRVPSQLALSEAATAEAEPVLAVAVGLAIPGREP